MKGRIKFVQENGVEGGPAGCGSVLISWDKINTRILENCGLKGELVYLKPPVA